MYTNSRSAASAYASVGLETSVIAANPHKLILMLFEGAQLAIRAAGVHMREGNVQAKGAAITKAITIIGSGLRAALDAKRGGEIAMQLDALYDYMCQRLFVANLKNRPEILEEVGALLAELHSAWKQIGAQDPGTAPAQGETRTAVTA